MTDSIFFSPLAMPPEAFPNTFFHRGLSSCRGLINALIISAGVVQVSRLIRTWEAEKATGNTAVDSRFDNNLPFPGSDDARFDVGERIAIGERRVANSEKGRSRLKTSGFMVFLKRRARKSTHRNHLLKCRIPPPQNPAKTGQARPIQGHRRSVRRRLIHRDLSLSSTVAPWEFRGS